MKTRLPSVSNSPSLTSKSVCCVCLCGFVMCVKRPKGGSWDCFTEKEKKRISVNIFCLLSSSQFFPPIQALLLPDRVHLLIDNWLQSHSGLLKYQAGASGFRPRPQAPLLSASGKVGSIRAYPSQPHSASAALCTSTSAAHRVRRGGADRVSVLTS